MIKRTINEIYSTQDKPLNNCKGECLKLEEKYGLENKNRLKERIVTAITEAFERHKEKSMDERVASIEADLIKWGKIFLDANGLKAINDFASHEGGDIFLERIAEVLTKNEKIKDFCEDNNLKIEMICREGGDEFSFLLSTDRAEGLRDEIEELRKIIVDEVSEISIKDLMNLESEKAQEKLGERGRELYQEAGGKEYNPSGSIAGGECDFFEVISKFAEDYNIGDREKLDFNQTMYKLMGAVQDLSDDRASINKEYVKKELRNSDNPTEYFTAFLASRTKESRELMDELAEARKENFLIREALGRCEQEVGKSYL